MTSISTAGTEIAILSRLIRPEQNHLSVAAARALLKIDFEAQDRERMRELLKNAKAGTLTAAEQVLIESYEVVGHLLDLLHSKARCALKKRTSRG